MNFAVVDPGRAIGSPLYSVLPEHAPALAAAALVLAGMWFVGRMASRRAPLAPLLRGYQALPSNHRFLVWMLALTASIHAGLVIGHEPSLESALFLADAVALFAVGRALVVGARWRLPAAIVLSASILGYAVVSFGGSAPDQVGLATKLVELAALTIVLTPQRDRRLRRLAGSAATVSLVLVTGIAAWAGAFIAAAGEGGHGDHGSAVAPAPGSVIRVGIDEGDATPEERAATAELYSTVVGALAKYGDPSVAAADGYLVEGLTGTDFHAANPAYATDGRIFDPARPENLVYAATPSGPVLLGAMYEMPSLTEPGPRIGGPLTEWHGHENVCFSIAPPAMTGLVSPFGFCPVGSITVPTTSEMIHVWTAPGAPQWFGDLDAEWLAAYLASFDRQT